MSERKVELERLERMIFHGRPRDDSETRGGKSRMQAQEDMIKDELTRLEEAFAKLRNATGVSKSEEVLDQFLSQQATKDSLQKMRAVTEGEKMMLERKRQELSTEIETRKFSETKSAEQWVLFLPWVKKKERKTLTRNPLKLIAKGKSRY